MEKSIIKSQAQSRRTFAIISHPDAGKTTLTEKLLLYAGMVRTAGIVGRRKSQKAASSDWLALEQERGISISASAMQFHYKDVVINVLDTPGHQDFSEDTYRTLTAADCAVMVIDASKGVETQTEKLFKVCRLRGIPILTFVNKMDLPAKDIFDLLSELEEVLGINASPINWPIGSGKQFIGVANCESHQITIFEKSESGGAQRAVAKTCSVEEALASKLITEEQKNTLTDELELLEVAGNPFSRESFLACEITPVFFGSAMTNFGIEPFFDDFAKFAPAPGPRPANLDNGDEILVDPVNDPFSAYVFKIQANMDPKHRDSMAFLRVNSGFFERDLSVRHPNSKKDVRLSRSHSMFGGERTTVDQAFPGDIIGVVNPGLFKIGDTVSTNGGFSFKPMPQFSPEVVAQVRPKDINKKKSFDKGVEQLGAEGAVLVLRRRGSVATENLIAAVGKLQFEVMQHRLESEYNVKTALDLLPYNGGAWLIGDPDKFNPPSSTLLAEDLKGRPILLYSQNWEREFALRQNEGYELVDFLQ
ncbi:MAG: peptide chain release factor 3 [Deltaproteobacteria bacterium]|nr:peptide chain release factor 3 [Deltaproteobacteria bacterium]